MSHNTSSKQGAYLFLLGLDSKFDGDRNAIRKTFRNLAAKYHPDRVPENEREAATERMKFYEEAKSWLLQNYVPQSRMTKAEYQKFRDAYHGVSEAERRKREREKQKRREQKKRRKAEEKRRARKQEQRRRKKEALAKIQIEKTKVHSVAIRWRAKITPGQVFSLCVFRLGIYEEVYVGKKKAFTCAGLEPGKRHQFRLCIFNTDGSKQNLADFEAFTTGKAL